MLVVENLDVAADLRVVRVRAGPDGRIHVLVHHAVDEIEIYARIVVGLAGRIVGLRAVVAAEPRCRYRLPCGLAQDGEANVAVNPDASISVGIVEVERLASVLDGKGNGAS